MAAFPPSSHSSSYTGQWEYDVFLCFRGDDTRLGFTSHLMAALSDKQIKTFIDDQLEKTESIDELISILQRSALSVVIFSENFADSIWCLEEVATISRRMAKFGHRVLPVFYKVDPSDVTNNSGIYAAAINDKFEGNSSSEVKKKRWMDALKAVANCAGHTSQAIKIESELVKAIVEDVLKQLIDMSSSIRSANLVGMGSRILEVEKLLAMDTLDDTRIIGLWGMGGVGKTTLAKACYQRIISSTRGIKHHFIGNINENCEKHQGVEEIVFRLYSELLDESSVGHEDLDISYRRERLSRLRVFIVLDGVETPAQLEQLLLGDVFNLTKLFATGSRIIVTTRNKKVLQNAEAKTYNVQCLNDEESIRLFSLHAFRQNCPRNNWIDQSLLATSYCKGNPLALRILGGALFGEDIHYWKSFLSGLKRTQKLEIHDVLRRSYDKLGAEEKRIFLDVACFLYGISRSHLVEYMSTMHPAAYAKVKDLIDRSLLTIVFGHKGEEVEVHDLLKEMAWTIVYEEPDLAKRSRLVEPDDIYKLLTTQKVKYLMSCIFNPLKVLLELVLPRWKNRIAVDIHWKRYNPVEEHRTTEGISLDLSKANEMYLEANAFEGMSFLTFLKFWLPKGIIQQKTKIHLAYGGLNSLPEELRWLEWEGYPSKSLPSKFHPQHLVHLIIRGSPIQRCWRENDQPQLVNLMVLDFSHCKNLIAIPDLSKSLKLEELVLLSCESLVEVPSHVQYLTKLIKLDLNYCYNLKRLPSKLDSKFLRYVFMIDCPKVTHCPEINSDELEVLDLDGTPVRELPSAIYRVKDGGALRLYGQHLTNFPLILASLGEFQVRDTAMREMDVYDHHHQTSSKLELPRFRRLCLYDNSKLQRLPKCIWNMVSHEFFFWHSPLIESLPEISEPLEGLTYLSIDGCRSLKNIPSSISNLKSLQHLTLEKTGIKSLPSSIQELDQLYSLNILHCQSLDSIRGNLHKLSHLYRLSLSGCRSIRFLPELPSNLTELDVSGCKSLQALPSRAAMGHWRYLRFDSCPLLDQTFFDEIVTNILRPKFFPSQPQLQCWRSELPSEFVYKSVKNKNMEDCCTVNVELPPLLEGSDQLILEGIAFGVVCSSDPCNPVVRCECLVDNGTTVAYSSICNFQGSNNSLDSLLVWLKVDNVHWERRERKEGEEEWYVKYAGRTVSFRFDTVESTKTFKIKSCGVSLVFERR